MLMGLALIFPAGMLLGAAFNRLHMPALMGMLVAGMLIAPLLGEPITSISAELRQIALVIILARAGLSLNIADLKKVGRPALLMCAVPACFEIAAMIFFAPKIMGITVLEAAILGSVIAAVSPAVIVPRMLKLMEEGYGTDKSIPQLIMAGASVDDVFVIVLFTAFISLAQGGEISLATFGQIPVSIILGIAAGVLCGVALSIFYKKASLPLTGQTLVLLSISFLLTALEKVVPLPFSGLLAVMAAGIALLRHSPKTAKALSAQLTKLWTGAEILLFVLVGATVDINYAITAGGKAALLLLLVVSVRMIGVYICLLGSPLNTKERIFCMVAYTPKATVQAAIGGIPLAMGLSCGSLVLTVAVLSILITAPLGAFGIDFLYKRWLKKS